MSVPDSFLFPWSAQRHHSQTGSLWTVRTASERRVAVCSLPTAVFSLKNQEAIARLIAASPELYKLCERSIELLSRYATHDADVDELLDAMILTLTKIAPND